MICEYTSELSNSVTGLQKLCMKPWQSLFLLVMAPSKLATSPLTNSHIALAHRFSSKRETASSLIYAKDCKDLFLSPTLIIVIAWVQAPPQTPLPSDFCWGEGVCAQTTLLYVLSRSIKETRTKTLHYNNLKMCVKKKKDKNYLFEDSFFFFHRVTWSILSCFMATMETSIFTLVQSNILYLLPIL